MTSTPREIGTLIVVVLKANHLPNKRHIGKQDPYCAITLDGQTRRTKAIKKGGQHPEWDEEIRFQVYEDDDEPTQADFDGTPPPLPPKDGKIKKIKGGMFMKLACYADDMREPDLIGEGTVDLTEVISKGESDEWYTLTYKDRFAGKVYLEMTLYSNEPEPPQKKKASLPANSAAYYNYLGPGVHEEHPPSTQSNQIVSTSIVPDHHRRQSDSFASSMRPSSSLAQLDLYQAPYEQNHGADTLTKNFGEFGLRDPRGSETPPSSQSIYRPPSSVGFSTISSQSSRLSDFNSTYSLNRPVTPNSQLPFDGHGSLPNPHQELGQPSGYNPPPPVRKARYSIPTSSSGFMPLPSSAATHNSTSSLYNLSHFSNGYAPPPSQTPMPAPYPSNLPSTLGYPPTSHTPLPSMPPYDTGVYTPAPPQTPLPASYSSSIHRSSSFENGSSIHPLPLDAYPHHGSASAPPLQLAAPQHQPGIPMSSHSTPPEGHLSYSPSHENLSLSAGPGGSRPLPAQPQGAPPPPLPLGQQQPYGVYNSHLGVAQPGISGFPSVPPPPPLPPRSQSPLYSPQSQIYENHQYSTLPSGSLSLPPPPLQTPHRRASLPQPPLQGNLSYPPLPPPPNNFASHGIPPPPPLPATSSAHSYYPVPPPRPPMQLTHSPDHLGSSLQPPGVYQG